MDTVPYYLGYLGVGARMMLSMWKGLSDAHSSLGVRAQEGPPYQTPCLPPQAHLGLLLVFGGDNNACPPRARTY